MLDGLPCTPLTEKNIMETPVASDAPDAISYISETYVRHVFDECVESGYGKGLRWIALRTPGIVALE